MATEQTTIAQYALDSNNRRFIIPFEYLSRPFVKVTLMGTDRRPLTLGSDYRYISINEIETTRAWGALDGYLSIELRRITSATDRLVEFSDGSVLRSRDMNVSAIQTIHIAEEARNLASDTLASDDNGNLDARGRRLVNLGDAVNPKDAMTLDQVTGWSQSALNQANRSQIEANRSDARAAAALVSQNLAAASQGAAKTSETNAKTSETNSKTSETKAKTSETKAKTSETKAKTSETKAKTSETNSKTNEDKAKEWAEKDVDLPVEVGKYSAKHWAEKALSSSGVAQVGQTAATEGVENIFYTWSPERVKQAWDAHAALELSPIATTNEISYLPHFSGSANGSGIIRMHNDLQDSDLLGSVRLWTDGTFSYSHNGQDRLVVAPSGSATFTDGAVFKSTTYPSIMLDATGTTGVGGVIRVENRQGGGLDIWFRNRSSPTAGGVRVAIPNSAGTVALEGRDVYWKGAEYNLALSNGEAGRLPANYVCTGVFRAAVGLIDNIFARKLSI